MDNQSGASCGGDAMRALTMDELGFVVGGTWQEGAPPNRPGGGNPTQEGPAERPGQQELPGGGYPGSGDDVGLGEFVGRALDNPASFLGEVADNIYEWFRDRDANGDGGAETADEAGLRPRVP